MRIVRLFLLMIILILAFFIYFDKLNPEQVTLFYLPGQSYSFSASILVVACLTFGLLIGYGAYLFNAFLHNYKHWQTDRGEKRDKEIGSLYRDGVTRLLAGDLKKASALLQKTLDRDPKRIDSYIALANVRLQEGEGEIALELLRKARDLEPKSLEVLFKTATTFEALDRSDDAEGMYKVILDFETNNRKALRALRDLAVRAEDWDTALELQKRVVKVAGGKKVGDEKLRLRHLRYEVARGVLDEGNADAARGELQSIVKESADFVPARVSLGDAQKASGRDKDAVKTWQDGYLKLGRSVFLARLEDYYMDAEDPATLLTFYRQTLNGRQDDMLLRLFYGKFCLRLEMIEEAIDQLFTVENSGVKSSQLSFLLAEAYRRRERMDDAINEYQKALGVDKHLRLGYICDACSAQSEDWLSRCGRCGTWGSHSLLNRQAFHEARLVEVREIRHGERA